VHSFFKGVNFLIQARNQGVGAGGRHPSVGKRSAKFHRKWKKGNSVNSTKFGQWILRTTLELLPHMSYLKAKMDQIWFQLGFRTRPHWAAYSIPGDSLAGFHSTYF